MIKEFRDFKLDESFEVKIEYNFHTHNRLCGHALGEVKDYVEKAIEGGLKAIGISDHLGQPQAINPYVKFSDLQDKYLTQFEDAKQLSDGKISLYKGGEIEFVQQNIPLYKEFLKKLDYLILGQHFYFYGSERVNSFFDCTTEDRALEYIKQVKNGLKTGLFGILAHPDLFLMSGLQPTERVIREFEELIVFAKQNQVLVELNANGIRSNGFYYPSDLLVDICKRNDVLVIISSDCHVPNALLDQTFKRLYAYAVYKGLNIADLNQVLSVIDQKKANFFD